MLKKLLKYEYLSVKVILLPVLLCLPALSLITVFVGILMNAVDQAFFRIPLTMAYTFCIICIAVTPVLVIVLLITRYYRSLFTDEGYLTMVLPVSVPKLTFSKLLNAFLWLLVYIVVLLFALIVSIGIPITVAAGQPFYLVFTTVWQLFISLFSLMTADTALIVIELVFYLLSSLLLQITVLYASITLGAVMLTKHRVLGAFLGYFVINSITSAAGTLLQYVFILFFNVVSGNPILDVTAVTGSFHFFMVAQIIMSFAVTVGLYFINNRLLKTKYNLE